MKLFFPKALTVIFFSIFILEGASAMAYSARAGRYFFPEEESFYSERNGRRYFHQTLAMPNDPYYSTKGSLYSGYSQLEDLWGVKLLNSEAAWGFTRGAGIVVAVVDSGVSLNHADLQDNIWINQREKNGIVGFDDDGNGFIDDINGWDFVNDDKDPSDLDGHGTHVAGIIGALKDNNRGIVGIAPEADIMAVRVLDASGGGSFSDVAQGIRYAAFMGARVINLSLGSSIVGLPTSDINLLLDAIRYARTLGSIVVAAAGNSGEDIANQVPARFDEVISVGALRHSYDIFYGSGALGRARFSERGEELDFMAPGTDILSLAAGLFTYTGYKRFFDGTSYYSAADGTSMAAPMVSGTIALLLAQNPFQSFNDIYRRLQYSSTDLEVSGFDNNTGWGIVNPFKALSEDYYDDGKVKLRFLAQPDAYDIVRKAYDPLGNLINQFDRNGNRAVFEVDSLTNKVLRVFFYDAQGTLQRTNEYYEDGVSIHLRILANSYVLEYAPSGLLSKKTFLNGDTVLYYPSGNRKTFSELSTGRTESYLDENFYGLDVDGQGRGRLQAIVAPGDQETRILEYWPSTDKVKKQALYISGSLQKTLEFYLSGALFKETLFSNEFRTYYENGTLQSFYDPTVRTLYEYSVNGGLAKTTEYFSTGIIKKIRLASPDSTGIVQYDYYESGQAKTLTYENGDFYEVYQSGNYKSFTYGGGTVRWEYYDENFYGTDSRGFGNGRLSRTINILPDTTEEYRYLEYRQGTDTVKIYEVYLSGVFTQRVELYENGVSKSKVTLPNGDIRGYYLNGNHKSFYAALSGLYTEYYDDQFYGNDAEGSGLGRKFKEIYSNGDEIRFLTYWNGTDTSKTKEFYRSGVYIKTVEYDRNGITEKKIILANGDEYEYYFSGNLKSSIISDVFHEYLDENFYGKGPDGHGKGRLSRKIEGYTETIYKKYFSRTDIAETIEYYEVGALILTETYNSYGQLTKALNTDRSYQIFEYRPAVGRALPKLKQYREYSASGKLIANGDYDVSGRPTKVVNYIEDGARLLLQIDTAYVYSSKTYTVKNIRYDYSSEEGAPLRLVGVTEENYLTDYEFEDYWKSLTSKRTTTYVYNASNRRFTETTEELTYYYDLRFAGGEILKTNKFTSYELNPSGTHMRQFYSLDASYQPDGSTVINSEEKYWFYHDNGRMSRYEVIGIKNGLLSSKKIYTYDTRGRLTEIQTFTFYVSGNIKTENLAISRVTFEYKDEDFNGEGKGRLAKKTNPDGSYEVYFYQGNTDTLAMIEYYRRSGSRYRVDRFGVSGAASASGLESAAFGGEGYFEMQAEKNGYRQESFSSPINKDPLFNASGKI